MGESVTLGPILVTGGSGFVGNCVVRRLLAANLDVHVLLREGSLTWRLEDIRERLCIHNADLIDQQAVRGALARIKPAVVLHLAAHGAYESQNDACMILHTNVIGTHNLLEASIAVNAKFFVNVGSSSEYGYRSEPMRESDRLEPNSIYAIAKAAQTHLCTLVAQKTQMRIVTFRLFSVFGPWEEPSRLLPTLIRRARAGQPLVMTSPDTARDFIYVDDVVDVLLNFWNLEGMNGEIFNLGTGLQSTLRDVVTAVQEIVGMASAVQWGGMPPRKWDASCWQADQQKTRDRLGSSPRCSLRQGISKMAAWMSEIGDDYGPHRS